MRLPMTARRVGGVGKLGRLMLAVVAVSISSTFFIAARASALSLPSVNVQLPVKNTLLEPVTNTVNGLTGGLGVPVTVQNTPATVGATVNTGLSVPASGSAASAPLQVSAQATLPAPAASVAPALTHAAQQILPSSSRAVSPARAAVAPATSASSSDPAPSSQIILARANTGDPAPLSSEHTTAAVQPLTPALGFSGFLGALPSALQNIARGLVGNTVDNFPFIIMTDFLIAMIVLSAGLSGIRLQAARSTD